MSFAKRCKRTLTKVYCLNLISGFLVHRLQIQSSVKSGLAELYNIRTARMVSSVAGKAVPPIPVYYPHLILLNLFGWLNPEIYTYRESGFISRCVPITQRSILRGISFSGFFSFSPLFVREIQFSGVLRIHSDVPSHLSRKYVFSVCLSVQNKLN